MNTIANTVASKLFVAFVAAAMLFTLAAPAKAATVEELQAQIAALMAQISGLSGSGSTATAACTFTRALTIGSEGADVKCLQDALTPTYFNNAGGSTGYFGPVTASAVAAWQSANGISPAAGYFGPVSQAKFAAMMTPSTPSTPSTPDDSDDSDDMDDEDDSSDLSGEASLDNVEVADGEDSDDIEEGVEDLEVAEITVEFADGDAMVTRLDIALDGTTDGNDDVDPWDVFDEISLWVDGDEVARFDATDEDEYLDEDFGTIRFSNLDIVAMEDEEVVIVVAASVQGSVDGSSDGADWDIAATGLRYEDADEVTSTETTAFDLQAAAASYSDATAEFTINEAGEGDDLAVESSDEDPDATTFSLDEDDNTEEMIFAFDLSAEDSDGDIDLNEITLHATVTSPASNVDDLVNDFRLEIDGQSFDAESYTGTALTATLVFDIDGDVTIAADEVVTAMLYADFEDMETADQGSTIVVGIIGSETDAEGAEDVDVDGSANSETHTLRTTGVDVSVTDTDATLKANTDATTTDDEGVFTIEFDVTAFGEDLYINDTVAQDLAMGTAGANYRIYSNGSPVASTTAAGVATLDSDAETSGGYFKVNEGDTESFTLTVEYDPASSGSFKAVLYSVNFNDTAADADTQQTLTPAEDYDTASLTI